MSVEITSLADVKGTGQRFVNVGASRSAGILLWIIVSLGKQTGAVATIMEYL